MPTPDQYTYNISDTANNAVAIDSLTKEITESPTVSRKLESISTTPTEVHVFFYDALLPEDETALAALISAHQGQPIPPSPYQVTLSGLSKESGRLQVESFQPTAKSDNAISHNFTDKCTWWSNAAFVENEVPTRIQNTRDSDGKLGRVHHKLAHEYIIDATHGRITREDQLVDSLGINYDVIVKVNGVVKDMSKGRDDHFADYFVKYEEGEIWWGQNPPGPDDIVEVSYHYATDSHFILKPEPGEMLKIRSVEAQFTTDLILNDTFCFQLYAPAYMAPYIHATLKPHEIVPVPEGTHPTAVVPVKTAEKFKTMKDFLSDSNGTYPVLPPIGGTGWRGLGYQVVTFPWNYQSSLDIFPGMEVHVYTENNREIQGSYSVVTLYTLVLPHES